MTRQDALELAQRKANDWQSPYRVLRCTDKGQERTYKVEESDSLDSPRGWVLVEVVRPTKPIKVTLTDNATHGCQP
jgi:hypothetical protein